MVWNAFDAQPVEMNNTDNVFADFLQTAGLYETKEINSENLNDWLRLLNGDIPLHSYCTECKNTSVFRMEPITVLLDTPKGKSEQSLGSYIRGNKNQWEIINSQYNGFPPIEKPSPFNWRSSSLVRQATNVICFSYRCAMDENHRIDYIVTCNDTSIRKIGQYPSIADLSFPELGEFKKVVSKQDMAELRRAIGLYAQGIGVGSYVYLRRIFERILDDAKNTAIMDGALRAEEYDKAHVPERIKLLKDYLPKTLVNNQVFYGIVSKGIHQLSEDECKSYFPVLQEFIFIILRQRDQMKKDRESEAKLSVSLSKIVSSIK